MSGDVIEPGQPRADDGEPPVVNDADASGRDDADDADDADEVAPSPKTDVPGESDADEAEGA